jgi:hypothetical protein
MKIAIISDTHDNKKNIEAFREIAEKKFDAVIHCGDLCAPVPTWFDWKIPIYYTFGNIDQGAAYEMMKRAQGTKVQVFKPFGEIELDGKKIAFIHYPELAFGLACTKKYDAIFYGHNHNAKKEKHENCWLVNPGEIAAFKGKPTFAVYDTKTNEVEIKEL